VGFKDAGLFTLGSRRDLSLFIRVFVRNSNLTTKRFYMLIDRGITRSNAWNLKLGKSAFEISHDTSVLRDTSY